MKLRRRYVFLYVVLISLLSLFIVFNSYDKYSRNSSINDRNRYLIENRLSEKEKTYLIDENIQVDLFLPYIKEKGFALVNYEYYNLVAKYNKSLTKEQVVNDANFLVAQKFTLSYLKTCFKNKDYTLAQLRVLATTKSSTYPLAKPEFYPSDEYALSNQDFYIYDYKPSVLKQINPDYTYNSKTLLLKNEANSQLNLLCDSLTFLTNKKCGDLKIEFGYLSYDDIIKNKSSLPTYIVPGHNDFQLGNSISFYNSAKFEENEMYLYLLENAHLFGFVQRYPASKSDLTSVTNQLGVYRYVGLKKAKIIYDDKSSIEQKHK